VQGEEPGEPLAPPLAHSCELGQVYAALRAATATTPGVRMEAWLWAQPPRAGACAAEPVQPNASFRLITPSGEHACCVELDRGCSIPTWQAKVRAYAALSQVGGGAAPTRVLTMTYTRSQRTRLLVATAQVLTRPSDAYLFGVLDDAHPARIGRWLTLKEVVPQPAPGGSPGRGLVSTCAPASLF